MICRKPALLLFLWCAVWNALLLMGCNKKPGQEVVAVEKPLPATAVTKPPKMQSEKPEKLPPPTMNEVEEAVHRVFGDAVGIGATAKPVYIVGDFNGDGMEDLAVIVEPVSSHLKAINSDLANWTLQDADKFFLPPQNARVVKPPEIVEPHVEEGEILLAVIHGYGPKGWRNPQARQTYLVKHAAGTFQGTERSFSEKFIRDIKLVIQTDLIKERRNKKSGFLFWTGSNYAWHATTG